MSQFALSFTIKPSSVRKDGTCMVYLLYCFSQKQKPLFDSRIAIPPPVLEPEIKNMRMPPVNNVDLISTSNTPANSPG